MPRVQLRPVIQQNPVSQNMQQSVQAQAFLPSQQQGFASIQQPASIINTTGSIPVPYQPAIQAYQAPMIQPAIQYGPQTSVSFQPQIGIQPWQMMQPALTQAFQPASLWNQTTGYSVIPQYSSYVQAFQGGLGQVQPTNLVQPRVEIAETNSEVVLSCELPAVDQNTLNLSLNDDSVTIQAQSMQGTYHRTVSLPTDIRPESSEASFNNGVLEVRMPKSNQARRRVNVNVTQK